MHQASIKYAARPDLKASGRSLLAAFVAAIPTMILSQLYTTGMGVINLMVGGLLYLITYLMLAPILGAVRKLDIDNLRTVLGKTRMIATLANAVLRYEAWVLSLTGRP